MNLINGKVFREVTLICGWVLIWATVELEIFSDIEALFPCDKRFTTISKATLTELKKKYTERE